MLIYFFLLADPGPPGEDDIVPQEAAIQRLLDEFKEAPLIGIEYLVEVIGSGPKSDPTYRCELCNTTLTHGGVISCLISAAHRLNYLVRKSITCLCFLNATTFRYFFRNVSTLWRTSSSKKSPTLTSGTMKLLTSWRV